MNLKKLIIEIVDLIDTYDFKQERQMPDLITTRSGRQLHFGDQVRKKIDLLSSILKDNLPAPLNNISYATLYAICRDSICNLYTEGVLAEGIKNESREHIKKLKAEINEVISNKIVTLTHHFQAQTCLFPNSPSFSIGPVSIKSTHQWVKDLDVTNRFFTAFGASPDDEANWKEELTKLISSNGKHTSENFTSIKLYEIIKKANSIIEVEIDNYEIKLSRQLAKITSQAAVDCFSLIFNNPKMFLQQNLFEHPTPPIAYNSLVSFSGKLQLPGMTINDKVRTYDGDLIEKAITDNCNFISATGSILYTIINKNENGKKNLSLRWTTALNWYAEAQREQDDAISLAKIGISLDVLSGGGTTRGILSMVKNLLDLDEQHVVFEHPKKTTLIEFIIDLYEHGRSQIVHGNHIDRLIPFDRERQKATSLCRLILYIAALRLETYSGDDSHDAFQKMPFLEKDGDKVAMDMADKG